MMIPSLVLLSVVAVLAEPEAPLRRYAVAPPSAPTLAYVAAPLVVGSQSAAPAGTFLAYTAPAAQQYQQYVARTYNGITTLALEQQPAVPVSAPLVAAPAPAPARAAPFAPARIVVTNGNAARAAPARFVVAQAEPAEPAPLRYYAPNTNLVFAGPAAPAAPAARVVAFAPQPAAPAPVVAVAPEASPVSSSSQFFSRNFNGVPTVTYFVVGPAPVTAPVAVAPQQGAEPVRRPVPGSSFAPAGEPVNQDDIEVLDA